MTTLNRDACSPHVWIGHNGNRHVHPPSLSFLRMMHDLGVNYDSESFLIMVQELLSIIGFF